MRPSRPNIRPLKRPNVSLEIRSILDHLEGASTPPKLIFICGGNSSSNPDVLSYRRKLLVEFLLNRDNLYYPILAENVFKHYSSINLMKLEEKISHAVDKIIIIIESQSALVELGAFSIDLFRKKLIVINDQAHIGASSFINFGPLRQIGEDNPKNLIHYKFASESKVDPCPISKVFPEVLNALNENSEYRLDAIYSVRKWNPEKDGVSPFALMLLHDIIYLIGPIEYYDLIDAYKVIYADCSKFDVIKEMRAMLQAMNIIQEITLDSKKVYKSSRSGTFFKFNPAINKFVARAKISMRKLEKK